MAIWTLTTETNYTTFYFPLKEDQAFFYELVNNYFEKSKPILEAWHSLFMLRSEPMKHTDFFEIDNTDVIAISQKAVDNLHQFFNSQIELLPIETDAGKYYALNVMNFINCLNEKESLYTATKNGTIVSYSLLEFNEEELKNNSIFKIPQLPYHVLVSTDIKDQCENNHLKGLLFDPKSNLIWYAE